MCAPRTFFILAPCVCVHPHNPECNWPWAIAHLCASVHARIVIVHSFTLPACTLNVRAPGTCVHLESACILSWTCVHPEIVCDGLLYCVRARSLLRLRIFKMLTSVCDCFCYIVLVWCGQLGMCEGLSEAWRPSWKKYFLWKTLRVLGKTLRCCCFGLAIFHKLKQVLSWILQNVRCNSCMWKLGVLVIIKFHLPVQRITIISNVTRHGGTMGFW